MKINEFIKEIEQNWGKHFPQSKIDIYHSTSIYNCIRIDCYICKDKSELEYNILHNDMLHISFTIDRYIEEKNYWGKNHTHLTAKTEVDNIDNYILLQSNQKSYKVKSLDKKFHHGHKLLKFRQTKGEPQKIIKKLDDFFAYLKKDLLESWKNNLIHENDIELLKSKLMT